jgi:putative peptidoglycan lipid II flippase
MASIESTESPQEEKQKRNQHIVQSTLMLMVLFLIAKGISLAQTFIIARTFGVGAEWDAYVAAAKIPDTIVLLLGGGALGYAFIPIFSGFLAKGDKEGAWRLASHVVNTIFSAAFVASVLAFIFTPWLMENVIASGFPPETMALSVSLMRTLLIGTLIFSVSGIVMGILQSYNHFLLPALAPIFNDLGILFGVVFLLGRFGVHGMVYGAVIGALLHLGIQIPGLIRYKAKWSPELGLNDPTLWRVIRLMLPRLAGLAVFNFNFIVMNNIASRLGEGAVAGLDWGWKLMQIPETLIGSAMGIVIFPTLAALSEVEDEPGKRHAMSGALKFIMIASIPSAVGLILIGRPLLSILEGGAFDADATDLVYGTLATFTLGLIVHSMLEIVARSFYADKDTITPLWASLGGAGINLALSLLLTGILVSETLDVGNVKWLGLANSLGVMFEVVFLLVILRKRWHGINENSLIMTTIKTIAASLIMAVAVVAVQQGFVLLGLEGRLLYTVAQLGLQVVVGGIAFLLAALMLGMEEIKTIIQMLLRRNKAALETVQIV